MVGANAFAGVCFGLYRTITKSAAAYSAQSPVPEVPIERPNELATAAKPSHLEQVVRRQPVSGRSGVAYGLRAAVRMRCYASDRRRYPNASGQELRHIAKGDGWLRVAGFRGKHVATTRSGMRRLAWTTQGLAAAVPSKGTMIAMGAGDEKSGATRSGRRPHAARLGSHKTTDNSTHLRQELVRDGGDRLGTSISSKTVVPQ